MSTKKACLFMLAVALLLPPPLRASEETGLAQETKNAMLIVKHQAMGKRKDAGNAGVIEISHFGGSHLAYTFETKKTWVRYIDKQSGEPISEEGFSSVGKDDELILMDYSSEAAYIHQSGLHENEFYHVRIIAQRPAGTAGEQGDETLSVQLLKAKVPEVKSVYPENWNDHETMMARNAYEKKIRAFCVEFNTALTAGLTSR